MFGSGDTVSTIIWFVVFMIFIFIYPRMMLQQLILQLEKSALKLEVMSVDARRLIVKKIGNESRGTDDKIKNFQEFIAIEPSSFDPYGIVKKVDQVSRNVESRFDQFVDEVASGKSAKEKREINFGLRAAIGVHMIAKIVRHYVETAKKFKNLQIAMVIQMQLPMIEKLAESELKGTEAFVKGLPVGDSIGPYVAASFMEKSKPIAEGVMVAETQILGRKVFVLKAFGPDPHLGRVDEAVVKIVKANRIEKVITIDAAGKLEGEKTGSVAEGVGFAMGGGVEREIVEAVLLPRKIPLDTIVVKVGMEDAITPMKKEILAAVPKVQELIKESVRRSKKNSKLILIGVGNSCGIGNDKKSLAEADKIIEEHDKKVKAEEAKKKKKFRFY
jgi:hypothetical protein